MQEGPPAPSSIVGLASWLLGRAASRGRALVAEALAAEGMKMWQHVALSALVDLGPVTQAELGRAVALDPKDLTAVVSGLVDNRLVTRTTDPTDGRKKILSVTTKGREVVKRCADLGREANDELLEVLSTEERKLFLDMLTRVARIVPHE